MITLYGKVTALNPPKEMNNKHRQYIELQGLGKGARNVYRIVNYGLSEDMIYRHDLPVDKCVEIECHLNGRKFTNEGSKTHYGMELVLSTIKPHQFTHD